MANKKKTRLTLDDVLKRGDQPASPPRPAPAPAAAKERKPADEARRQDPVLEAAPAPVEVAKATPPSAEAATRPAPQSPPPERASPLLRPLPARAGYLPGDKGDGITTEKPRLPSHSDIPVVNPLGDAGAGFAFRVRPGTAALTPIDEED